MANARRLRLHVFARLMGRLILLVLVIGSSACTRTVTTTGGASATAQAVDVLVEQSRISLHAFLTDEDVGPAVRSLLHRARAIAIYPAFGLDGWNGVALARDSQTWNGPAFCGMREPHSGSPIGEAAAEVLLVALTDRGRAALLATSSKLGADAGLAVGPIGLGAVTATQTLSADIVTYVRVQGRSAGVSVDGAVVAIRPTLNQAYFGRAVSPTGILIQGIGKSSRASEVIRLVRSITDEPPLYSLGANRDPS